MAIYILKHVHNFLLNRPLLEKSLFSGKNEGVTAFKKKKRWVKKRKRSFDHKPARGQWESEYVLLWSSTIWKRREPAQYLQLYPLARPWTLNQGGSSEEEPIHPKRTNNAFQWTCCPPMSVLISRNPCLGRPLHHYNTISSSRELPWEVNHCNP